MEELTSGDKEFVLDRKDADVLYKKLESKDNLINDLQAEVEALKSVSYEIESVNDDSNKEVALSAELQEKKEEINFLSERITLLESEGINKSSVIEKKDKEIAELRGKLEIVEKEENAGSLGLEEKEQEIAELREKIKTVEVSLGEKEDIISEQKEAIEEQQQVIAKKTDMIKEKVSQLEHMKIEFGQTEKLKKELQQEKERNDELQEIQSELEESLNDYERRLGENETSSKVEESTGLDLGDTFPVITDNSVLNARKICYIREIGENPWLEDLVCYLSAMLKSDLQNTQIEPYFLILDDLSSDIRRMKYKNYDFTLNALPAFGGAPESNVTVTSFTNIPDLKAHLNISNQEFLVIIDRYGKSKPFMKRRMVTEYNLVNNAELVNLCKLPKDESLVATFAAKNLVNSVELPTDYAIRGKRDRISLFLSKKAYADLLDNLKAGLFK